MDRLARLVVHVEEAIRLSRDESDLASLRLGLMLFDAAAELLLHRTAVHLLEEDTFERQTLNRYQEDVAHFRKAINQSNGADQESLNGLQQAETRAAEQEERVLGIKRREKIERHFKEKANFVVDKTGALSPSALTVMKKLHRYRNDTYHQDRLRPATVAASAQIYGHIVLDLMTALRPKWVTSSGSLPPRLAKYFPKSTRPYDVIHEAQARVADALRTEHSLVVDRELAEALALHAIDRLDYLDEVILWATSHLSAISVTNEEWTPEATLRNIQLDVPPLWSAIDAEVQDVPVTGKRLRDWRRRANALASESNAITAFQKFLQLEDEMDEIETELHIVAGHLEESEDLEFQRLRGK